MQHVVVAEKLRAMWAVIYDKRQLLLEDLWTVCQGLVQSLPQEECQPQQWSYFKHTSIHCSVCHTKGLQDVRHCASLCQSWKWQQQQYVSAQDHALVVAHLSSIYHKVYNDSVRGSLYQWCVCLEPSAHLCQALWQLSSHKRSLFELLNVANPNHASCQLQLHCGTDLLHV